VNKTSASALDAALIAAHAAGDLSALVRLYAQAADGAEHGMAEAFFLTQAYVFALEAGSADAGPLLARLIDLGCESAPSVDPALA
jgi:hypothetical protein